MIRNIIIAMAFLIAAPTVAAEFHGTLCGPDGKCQPVTGTVTWPSGTTDASSELSRSYRGQLGAPIATDLDEQCAKGSEAACAARDHGASPTGGGYGTGPGEKRSEVVPQRYRAEVVSLSPEFWRRLYAAERERCAIFGGTRRKRICAPHEFPVSAYVPNPQAIVLQPQLHF